MEQQKIEDLNPFDILAHFHYQVRIPEQASDTDAGLTKLYLEGVEEENLDKIYHFVHSVEIGCGFRPDAMLNKIFSDAYNQDAAKTFATIDSRTLSVVDAINLLSCMTTEQILSYIKEHEPKNPVLLLEIIRRLLKNADFSHCHATIIAKGITRLAEIDVKRFTFLLKHHEHSANWFVVLPAVLDVLSDEALLLFGKTIDLDHRIEDQPLICNALHHLETERSNHIFSVISEEISARWTQLCEKHRQTYKFHTSLYITGYVDFILNALVARYDSVCRNQLLLQSLQTLYADLHRWYKNESQLQSIFFLDLTNVYFLLLTLEQEEIDSQLFPLLQKLKPTLQRFKHAWKHGNYIEKEILEECLDRLFKEEKLAYTIHHQTENV